MDLKQQVLLFVNLQMVDVATTEKKVELFIKRTRSTRETYFGWLTKWQQLDAISDHDERVKQLMDWSSWWTH